MPTPREPRALGRVAHVVAGVALGALAGSLLVRPARGEEPSDAFARVCQGDAAGAVAAMADPYRRGALDPWSARLYQDLRVEAGERAAVLEETKAAFPEPRSPLGQWLLARLSDRKELDAALQRALLVAPDPLPVLLDQGWAALAADRLPYAASLLGRVRKAVSGREEATVYEARVLEAGGDRAAAERVLALFVAAHPDASDARRVWAEMLLASNKRGDATQVLDEALARRRLPSLVVARAAAAVELGDFESAKKLLEEAKDAGRPSLRAQALALRSATRLAARDDAAAEALADEALKVSPTSVHALRAKARCLEVAGKTSEALARVEAALDLRPTWSRLLVDKGAILLRAKQTKEARKVLTEARKRDPENLDAALLLGVLAEEDGDWITAEKAYRGILKADPDQVAAHRVLAGVLFGLGKIDQADAEAGWVLERLPKDPAAWFVRGRVALRQDKYEDALGAFQKAIDAEPGYGLAHTGRGWVFEEQDKRDDAKKAYEAAIAADPKLPLPHRYLAELLEDLNDASGALTHYKAYLELGGADPDEDVRHSVERLSK